jgi:hypothetical protein
MIRHSKTNPTRSDQEKGLDINVMLAKALQPPEKSINIHTYEPMTGRTDQRSSMVHETNWHSYDRTDKNNVSRYDIESDDEHYDIDNNETETWDEDDKPISCASTITDLLSPEHLSKSAYTTQTSFDWLSPEYLKTCADDDDEQSSFDCLSAEYFKACAEDETTPSTFDWLSAEYFESLIDDETTFDPQFESPIPTITSTKKMSGKFCQIDQPERLLDRIVPYGDNSTFVVTPEKASEKYTGKPDNVSLERIFDGEFSQATPMETPSHRLPSSTAALDTKHLFVPKKPPRPKKWNPSFRPQPKEYLPKSSSRNFKGHTYSDVLKHGVSSHQDFHKAERI